MRMPVHSPRVSCRKRRATEMTKREARAIMNAKGQIEGVLNKLEAKLKGDELSYFQNYWGSHIRHSLNSDGFGCASVERALEALGL